MGAATKLTLRSVYSYFLPALNKGWIDIGGQRPKLQAAVWSDKEVSACP